MKHHSGSDIRNLLVALLLCTAVLLAWQVFYESPRRDQMQRHQMELNKRKAAEKATQMEAVKAATVGEASSSPAAREESWREVPRLRIQGKRVHGSIALKGARFDDLTLAGYHIDLDKTSPEVVLLAPSGGEGVYFAQVGWVSPDRQIKVPDDSTVWKADRDVLRPGEPATLTWENGTGQIFSLQIALDQDYMFTVRQRVENKGQREVTFSPYGLMNRSYADPGGQAAIYHEGPIGVIGNALQEFTYSGLREEPKKNFEENVSWLGFSDKYWLGALVPDFDRQVTASYSYYRSKNIDRYQADFLGAPVTLKPDAVQEHSLRLFAGAKEIDVLDRYAAGGAKNPPIPLFDRAVDFGVLYFLTKPMFLMLNFFYAHLGNFGIAIMLLTVVVKLALYPLANKAYRATSQMRELQPQMEALRERSKDDKLKFNQELMQLYKREKVNPASGCLPVLIQLPVFLALYKVLMVTIEMRHAPFFGWIKDLSIADPSNIFTLFGVLHWNPPSLMHLGILPILMTATMAIQMKQQPKPADPVQAKIITYMPYFFLFIFASFPAGLVLYWVWSNLLSILQQHVIMRRYKKAHAKKSAKAA